jgi:hypothetical protein
MGIVWAVCRFFVQRATVTLQNNEHDDTQDQQQRIRSHHDHLLRRFLHPQLPKIIIGRREEWKSCIRCLLVCGRSGCRYGERSTLTTIPWTLRKGDGFRTKSLIGTNSRRQSFAVATNCRRPALAIPSHPSGFVLLMGIVQ